MLPKVSGADRIQQFRPICLLRCPYKLITKVLDRRAACVADALISSTQNAFIKGRNITDGILALHEILNYTHVSKKVGIVLKLDFEKAYDKVNWDFLLECHSMRGFSETWCGWIKKILYDGSVSIKLNNCVGPYFHSAKGVRQGDPHSPFLFNLAAECLAKMIKNAQRNKLIVGLAADLIPDGIAVLQYADDTIICIEHDVEKAVNLKLLLYIFEMMCGLKVNYQKSEIFTVGGDENVIKTYANMFNCDIGKFPIKYLGMPVSYTALKNSDWEFIVEKYMKWFEAWIGNAASMGGRLTLLDSVITQISIYHMSMWLMNKTFIERLDKHRRSFFWQGNNNKRRYHMVKWGRVCRSKQKGGLGVKDLRKQNISLMVKWWWKLETKKGVWQDIIKARYLRNKTVTTVKPRFSDSPCWKSILKVREFYLVGRKVNIESGDIARIWHDSIVGLPPFKVQFPMLFDICNDTECTVNRLCQVDDHSFFRRRLNPELKDQ